MIACYSSLASKEACVFDCSIQYIQLKKYNLTLVGLAVSALTYAIIMVAELEIFEAFVEFVEEFEAIELDEIFIPLGLFLLFAFIDLFHRHRVQRVEIEKQKVYEAMLSSSNHVLNNLINQMQLFRFYAEETEGFPKDALRIYDETIEEASAKIKAMANVTKVDEEEISLSVHPDFFEKKDHEP